MFVIEKYTNKITLTRGDSAEIAVSLTDNLDIPYEMQEGDTLTLSVKRQIGDEEYLLQKTIDTDTFKLEPDDTNSLLFGRYIYDIELTTNSGKVHTVIPLSTFVIAEEVTV